LVSENAMAVLERRYLQRDGDNKIIETVEGMFRRVADAVAAADLAYGRTEAETSRLADEFYRMMLQLDFLPNSPTLMNAGLPLGQLAACFVLPVPDTMEGIFEAVKNTAMIHKSGGGTGFNFATLRPKGAMVQSTGGVASGPISFMKVFNAATEAVKQGGKRRGANMGILRVDHPDILEFIQCKENSGELGNFNISVGISDAFMAALAMDGEYPLVDPANGQVVRLQPAKAVFDLIVKGAWLNGEPGVLFLDRIEAANPTPAAGRLESTNPCGEQPLLPYESCNLGSINLLNMLDESGRCIDDEKLAATVRLAVRFLDNVIDINNYPIPEIAEKSRASRKIGLGIMGYADLLIRLGIPYDSDGAVELAGRLMHQIDRDSKEASRALAEEKGVFPLYPGSRWEAAGIRLRNATTTTIAPTGTISMIASCSSGIEPLFAVAYYKYCMDQDKLPEVHPYFLQLAREQGFYSDELLEQVTGKGSLSGLTEVPEKIRRVFVTAHEISPAWQIRIQAEFQKHTDNAVSKTINFSHHAREEDIRTAYLLSYQLGCKGTTVYRDGSREGQVLNISAETPPPAVKEIKPRRRPELTQGFTEKAIAGCGNLYITVNADENGICEVFTNLGKGGGCPSQTEATSRLVSLALRSGLSTVEIIEQMKGIRCPSTLARKSKGEDVRVLSCPDAISRALEKVLRITGDEDRPLVHSPEKSANRIVIKVEEPVIRTCPECGGRMESDGGCVLCRSCGYSKCG